MRKKHIDTKVKNESVLYHDLQYRYLIMQEIKSMNFFRELRKYWPTGIKNKLFESTV